MMMKSRRQEKWALKPPLIFLEFLKWMPLFFVFQHQLNKYREPDLSFVIQTTEAITPHLRSGQVVSLESTTYPGTTEEELLPRLQKSGLKVGKDFFLVYSPEREDPMNPNLPQKPFLKFVVGTLHHV